MTTPAKEVRNFCSLSQLYSGNEIPDLQLTIKILGDDSIAIELLNLRFKQQRWNKFKNILTLVAFYIGYSALTVVTFQSRQLLHRRLFLDVGFVLYLLYTIFSILSLVECEKCLFCIDFALQKQTVRFPARTSNFFVPAANIHDIVINEVIENLDVHYLLILRTKGKLFKQKPIITLFDNLRPSIQCLEEIYKHLNNIQQNTQIS